jgi:hypothetical protein
VDDEPPFSFACQKFAAVRPDMQLAYRMSQQVVIPARLPAPPEVGRGQDDVVTNRWPDASIVRNTSAVARHCVGDGSPVIAITAPLN